MDIQLFGTDKELQDFPENKTDSTVLDKTPNSNSINLTASDLPRSHSHLPKISSRLPERKSKRRSRRGNRHQARSKNPIVGWQADTANKHTVDHQAVPSKLVQAKFPTVDRLVAQTNDQLDIKQKIQWVVSPETYLDRWVGCQGPPSEAALPGQPALSSPEIAPPVAHQLVARQPVLHPPMVRPPVVCQPGRHVPRCCPFVSGLTWTRSLKPSHPRHYGTSTSVSRSARTY